VRRSTVSTLSVRILLALALVCACVTGARAQFSSVAQQQQMPNVVGLTSEQAATRLRRLGLSVQTRDVPSTEARGTVTAQSPAAGSGVKPGQGATLDVSTGQGGQQTQTGDGTSTGGGRTGGGTDGQARPPQPGQVPDLTGLSRNLARLRLMVGGLVLGAVDSAWVEGAQGGRVVAQDPKPGTQAVPGQRVRVTLASRTPPAAPRDTQPSVDLVAVPDLAGMTAERARAVVGRSRLLLGEVDSARAGQAAPGTVLAQQPAAGERVRPGSFVAVTVAQEPRVAMPSLVGRPVADARRVLVAAGLRAGATTERDAQGTAGRVLAQSIPAGTQVRPGTAVDLGVSRVPVPVAQVDTFRRDTTRRDTIRKDTARTDTTRTDTTRTDTTQKAGPRVDTLVATTGPSNPARRDPEQIPAVTTRRPAATPAGIPREVWWGVAALLVLAAGAILYRITRRGVRQPVRASAPVPAPVSAAVRLSVGGGEWEPTSRTEADAAPPLGGKLRLNVRIAELQPTAHAAGAAEAALGSTRVTVRGVDDGPWTAGEMDDAEPVLAGAAVQVRVRDDAPTFTVDHDTPIILGRRR
jgi:beta-lactam-binding protein with PASTA domain